jgi:hypothetical protein
VSCTAARKACVPLQLQLLGCDRAASAVGGDGSVTSSSAAKRNTGLQELTLRCPNWLSDDELAAAAAALPDLRRLGVMGGNSLERMRGLTGAGLAAFTSCRRLRDIALPHSADLEAQQLLAQLPRLGALTSVKLRKSVGLDSSTVTELQAAFQAEHGRHLHVDPP